MFLFYFCNMNSIIANYALLVHWKAQTVVWLEEEVIGIFWHKNIWRCHWLRRVKIKFWFHMFKGLTRCWPRHDWKPQCKQKAQTVTSSIVYIASAEELQWFKLTLYYLLMTNLLLLAMYRLLLSIVYYNGPNVFNRIYGWCLIKCVEALKILSPNGYLINLPFI